MDQHGSGKEDAQMTHETENTNPDEWGKEEVHVERPVSAVVSVRLPADLADRLAQEAASRRIGLSALVRDAVYEYVASLDSVRSSYDWSVSSPDVSVSFYAGRGVQGRTAGSARTLDEVLLSS
jgi:hypothetical protein